MIQAAGAKTPYSERDGHMALDVPLLFLTRRMINTVAFLGLISIITEIWYGFKIIGWWSIGTWILGMLIALIVFPGKNPAPSFFIGVIVATIGLGLLLLASQ